MSKIYKCGNCGRLLGDEETYSKHLQGCSPRPAEAEEPPLFWPERPWAPTDYDKMMFRRKGIRIDLEN